MPAMIDSGQPAPPSPVGSYLPRQPGRFQRWRTWAIVVLLCAGVVGGSTVVQNEYWGPKSALLLTAQGPSQALYWIDDQDAAEETRSVDADGIVTRSVPMRKGYRQGVVVLVTNVSTYDVTLVGPEAPRMFQVQASTTDVVGAPNWKALTFADRVTIPAGGTRYLKIMTAPNATCVPYSRGGGLGLSDIGLVVSTRWVTKVDLIAASDQAFLISQSDTTPAGCIPPTG